MLGRVLLEVTGPAQQAVSSFGSWLGGIWDNYFALVHAAKQNKELKETNAIMRQDLVRLEELEKANQRLRGLLGLKEELAYPVSAAEVVAGDMSAHFHTVVINKGSADGILPQMPVVHAQGAVGRVIWTSLHYAKVLLLIDPNSGVDVFVQRSRAGGIVQGAGQGKLELKYVQHNFDLAPGDRLVTSGSAGVFPRGILVGTALTVEKEAKGAFMKVMVEPAVDFARLEEVLVILQRRKLDD